MSYPYEGVAVLAPVTIAYRRHAGEGAAWFVGQALREILAITGVEKTEIDGLAVSSFSLAPDTTVTLAEHYDMTLRWAEQVAMGGASAVIALRRAARAVQAGDAELVACIGGDGHRRGEFARLVSNFSDFSRRAAYPYGAAGPNGVFSLITRAYMDAHGATREDFGRICIAQRANAGHNPLALLREPLTMEDYLGARPIAEPLHLYDCVMPCAGAPNPLALAALHRRRRLPGHLHRAGAPDRVAPRIGACNRGTAQCLPCGPDAAQAGG